MPNLTEKEFPLKEETYQIIGAAMEVHRTLGPGFLEAIYQEALSIEFKSRNIIHTREVPLQIQYKEHVLSKKYVADFITHDQIIVELKALNDLCGDHEAQVLNYLKATNFKVGILLNFGCKSLQYKRIVL
ncbi:GxxExxY protein [Natronoflexus pectinivorans]|uniref:GxxExxY protein n=1 Tax=Natronoflexus pectinivorans TaxID=682526 RepID=A0A4R2GFI1_9BACT|nr:GxxExxY protein [Natronoflexus pectinivorans]TCO06906.1 GxxExxY protein [Natronoflexus pectinivorans]